MWKGSSGLGQVRQRLDFPHSSTDKLGGTTEEQNNPCNPRFLCGEIKPQNLWLQKPVTVAVAGETPSLTGESIGEAPGVLEHTQAHPPGNQYLKGHNLLVASEGSDRKWGESRASWTAALFSP